MLYAGGSKTMLSATKRIVKTKPQKKQIDIDIDFFRFYENLSVTAKLSSPIVVFDDWTPSLEGIIIWHILDKNKCLYPHPNEEQMRQNQNLIDLYIPIEKNLDYGFYYCSNPVYVILSEETTHHVKRWNPHLDGHIEWGKRKAVLKYNGQGGPEKQYYSPIFLRTTNEITWYCRGDYSLLQSHLSRINGLGRMRSHGYGQVYEWTVEKTEEDWSVKRDGKLTKAVSTEYILRNKKEFSSLDINNLPTMTWGWKPPFWDLKNKTFCFMPEVVKRG
jgi:hypothetical protein